MRLADALTLFRAFLVFVIAYLILVRYNVLLIIVLIAAMYIIDALDGYFSILSISNGTVGMLMYLRYSFDSLDKKKTDRINSFKAKSNRESRHGPRIDIAGDRVVEYTFWVLFTYLNIVPLFVIFVIVLRNSFADAFMGERGTSSKLKTRFAQWIYGSALWRGGQNVIKAVTFVYLTLVYLSGWPIFPGYVLVAILVLYSLLRGVAEIYESMQTI